MNTAKLQNKVAELQAKRNDEEGFTLVELLVVITILGVLAAVVVFSVNGISNNSAKSACESDKKAVEVAIEAYRAENGAYPAALTDLEPNFIRDLPGASTGTNLLSNDGSFTYVPASGALNTVTACS